MFYFISVVGNAKLEKWSANSLRRAGLCQEHFTADSFLNESCKRLKRNALPIPYDDGRPGKNGKTDRTETIQVRGAFRTEETSNITNQCIEKRNMPEISLINKIEKEMPQKSYHSSRLNFDTPMEKEDITEWIHIEPQTCQNVPVPKPQIPINIDSKQKKRGEKSNFKAIIAHLQFENIQLRRQVKDLKLRLLTVERRQRDSQ